MDIAGCTDHVGRMTRKPRRRRVALPLLFTELAFASWETIVRRGLLMATGGCSPAEYRRMIDEKTDAAWTAGLAVATGQPGDALHAAFAPYHRSATKNAKRLRRPVKR
jgi:hypothetical protein